MTLGTYFWYRASDPTVTMTDLLTIGAQVGMDDTALPRQILPIDVFRRLSGPSGPSASYTLNSDLSVRLTLRPVKETRTMLSRVVTRTLFEHGRATDRKEVADFVFYTPPRGEISKSRVRATLRNLTDLPDKDKVERFAQALRDEYKRGLEFLDAQGVRRLVRMHLANSHALSIDSVYFLPDPEPANQLCYLLDRVGNSRGHQVRADLQTEHLSEIHLALTAAHQRGKVSPAMLDAYTEIVPETVEQLKKEALHG